MIVVKNNEASEYYANYCTKSWEAVGLKVQRFDAIVPDNLNSLNQIRWKKYSDQKKYSRLNINVEITDTEKACFYSHYMLWKKCIEKKEPILVIEHDSYLEHPENLWIDSDCGMIFYDKASMGSYVIFPWFAQIVVNHLKKSGIGGGPYGILEDIARRHKAINKHVNIRHKRYKAASNQVMSDRYGNTIEHFCTSNPHLFNPDAFHKFIKI